MTYTEENFKSDLIINISNQKLKNALDSSVFEFSNNNNFTNREWNTYSRKLMIYCKEENYEFLELNKKHLYQIADKVHNVKDDYMLMGIDILKRNLDGVFSNNNENTVILDNNIKFNKNDDCIGEGGFARVYKYECPILDTFFAFKVLDPSSFNDAPFEINVARFIREASTLIKFSHNNIVKVYDIGKVKPNSFYIKMEWIDGLKLKDYINNNGPISTENFIHLTKQMTSAIAYSHSFNILHRDLSERNIMVTADGVLKVLDFGLAKDYKHGVDLTTLSHIINTDNMAPEVKDSIENYSIQSDIYALGCIMFRILTNKTINIEFENELNNNNIPQQIVSIIKKCLSVDKSKRYNNCEEIYDDLENYNRTDNDVKINKKNQQIKKDKKASYGFEKDNFILSDFSLDEFKKLVDEGISELKVDKDFINDFDIYKKLIEIDFPKIIQSNKFVKDIIIADVFKYLGCNTIRHYKQYKISIIDMMVIVDFYNSLNQDDKDIFIYNIKNIVDGKIKRTDSIDEFLGIS